ncbi:craniofacial development protein 2-like [Penaeus indicus]|uniref:craniofacial development protein 2-like n=1 Tax=Penaeus indicus TaxID=29960 RepID=UPI00300CC857
MRRIRNADRARAYPAGDASDDRRDPATNGQRLPYQERIRLKKQAQRKKKKREARRTTRKLRIGTLNVGTMTGRGKETVDMMERRSINILCVQETKWKGAKAREMGNGYKMYYVGHDTRRNGVGIVLDPEMKEGVLQVHRESDRVMWMKVEVENEPVNIVCAYAPQVGCDDVEKEDFWRTVSEVMVKIPRTERVWIGADLNGHVGGGAQGYGDNIGKFGFGTRNEEGQTILDFVAANNLAVTNTYFKKKDSRKITYTSGGVNSQVDYVICRRSELKRVQDCKVLPGEAVAKQHKVVICTATMKTETRKKPDRTRKTRWWKLNEQEHREKFVEKVREGMEAQAEKTWAESSRVLTETAKEVLGVTSGKPGKKEETWWWGEEVQDAVKEKKEAKKQRDLNRCEETIERYKAANKAAKRAVAKAKSEAYKDLYDSLKDDEEGQRKAIRIAKQKNRESQDVYQSKQMKNTDGAALRKMKNGKATGPDNIPVEAWRVLGRAGVKILLEIFTGIMESERMPDEWRDSTLIPIFKNKGDIQESGNYRGIKLMSHTLKIWERIIDGRLRAIVTISEQQFGFMPGRSTTDAIFALRQLMEKYREGQRELHSVFIDLEKAYDRVP